MAKDNCHSVTSLHITFSHAIQANNNNVSLKVKSSDYIKTVHIQFSMSLHHCSTCTCVMTLLCLHSCVTNVLPPITFIPILIIEIKNFRYVHDGSESFKDGFKVGVNDGLHFVSGIVRVSVEPVDDEKPLWKKGLLPRISISEGGSFTFTSEVRFCLLFYLFSIGIISWKVLVKYFNYIWLYKTFLWNRAIL